MLWRLPPSVRSLLVSNCRRYGTKTTEPLRVLFCGSDEFSIASLQALDKARSSRSHEGLIESIEVVHRPGKRTGRGLKIIRDVPIKQVATELKLKTHEIDTFTGWTPPNPFDLVIAVSFGLFVPPRILNIAKYGGLNVHPSLLPDLRGPAPIHHTLLKKRKTTGVTVQTLHPKHFDKGLILAQTLPPGVSVIPNTTVALLTEQLGWLGGQLLLDVLRNRAFIPPLEHVGWYPSSKDDLIEHAEKITPAHKMIDFSAATLNEVLTRHRVLGDLWYSLPNGERIVFHEILEAVDPIKPPEDEGQSGLLLRESSKFLLARTIDMHLIVIPSSTVSGGKRGAGLAYVKRHYGEAFHDGKCRD